MNRGSWRIDPEIDEGLEEEELLPALSDGTVLRTTDGGHTRMEASRP